MNDKEAVYAETMRALPDDVLAAVAWWIESTPKRYFVLDCEKRLLAILADDLRYRRVEREVSDER